MLNSNRKSTRSLRELTIELSEEQDPKRMMRLVEELISLLEAEDKATNDGLKAR